MEKFAVDLDKVLDDFEFNEDRAEQLANVPPKRRQAAATPRYRRAPFTLADADFAAAVPSAHQPWNVENTLRRSNSEADPSLPYSIPKNINASRSLSYYENNSFKDEFLEHKPNNPGSAAFPDQVIEPKWLKKSQDAGVQDNKKTYGNPSLSNKINVSGVFSSLNDYMNAGTGSKVNNAKDVKTVSNDLTVNKIKNLDKNSVENQHLVLQNPGLDIRNLPDVASTSNRPSFQNVSTGTNFDLPNNTFDLVTNLSKEQDTVLNNVGGNRSLFHNPANPVVLDNLSRTSVSNVDSSEEEYMAGDDEYSVAVKALNNVFKTFEIRNIKNISTQQPSNDITGIRNILDSANGSSEIVPDLTEEKDLRSDITFENPWAGLANSEKTNSQGVDGKDSENLPAQRVVSFTEVNHLSDSELLNYLQEIEDEIEETSDARSLVESKNNRDTVLGHDSVLLTTQVQTAAEGSKETGGEVVDVDTPDCPKEPARANPVVNELEREFGKKDNIKHPQGGFQNISEVDHPYRKLSSDDMKGLAVEMTEEIKPQATAIGKNLNHDKPALGIDCETGVDTVCANPSQTASKELGTSRDENESKATVLDAPTGVSKTPSSSQPGAEVVRGSVTVETVTRSDEEVPSKGSGRVVGPAEDSESESMSPDEEDETTCGSFATSTSQPNLNQNTKLETQRPSVAIVEVRSPMVQSPRDGGSIHVLGEEERPTRPKYLFLPSKITMGTTSASAEGEGSSEDEAVAASTVGPPGATPHAYSTLTSIHQATDNQTLEENQNLINTNQTFDSNRTLDEAFNRNRIYDPSRDDTLTTAGVDNDNLRPPTEEQLDNAANMNLAADEDPNLSSPDLSESSVETASPPPIVLAPDGGSLSSLTNEDRALGFVPPFWIPDNEASACMLCDLKFTVLRRRHHCRACGKVLCSKCCCLKSRLEYMDNAEGRVCLPCHETLLRVMLEEQGESAGSPTHEVTTPGRQPHPNNPMDYCSTIPPLQQVAGALHNPTPSVLVPVGVLKRQGSSRPKSEVAKQVMFSDGIRPGGDLTELDGSGEPRLPFRRPGRVAKRVATPPGAIPSLAGGACPRPTTQPPLEPKTLSYIPSEKGLPPVATFEKGELKLDHAMDDDLLLAALKSEQDPPVMFAINRNLYVNVKVINLSCCVNRVCWCFSTRGLRCVSQDEILLVLEMSPDETAVPRDVFCYLNTLYQDAVRGSTVSDLGCTLLTGPFLGSSDHGAFVYIRPSFQCLHKLPLPPAPYLVAILVHRSETPWARVFPIRLVLRLGAEFRYYPCSLVSVRHRKSVYHEVGHTIMNLLADFRNLSYTLPSVRGLVIHMEDKQTTILLPKNRYDQVTRALNNSNEHVLALAANLSLTADSHLVCVQSKEDLMYHTQAINIHSKPRRVTGASFVVFNGALKTCSNLTAKSSIVEDGLMVQITPDTMQALHAALRNMKDWSVGCGPTGAESPDETVSVKWVADDKNFNVGVCSVIDGRNMDGVPSIRVHNGTDYHGRTRLVRWTEVFILESDEAGRTGDPLDVGRLSESIARAVCMALVNLLDLLAQADYHKFAIRASIHPDNVCYEGGSKGEMLPPIYMNSLDNELVSVLHTAATANENTSAVLELVFHVLLQ